MLITRVFLGWKPVLKVWPRQFHQKFFWNITFLIEWQFKLLTKNLLSFVHSWHCFLKRSDILQAQPIHDMHLSGTHSVFLDVCTMVLHIDNQNSKVLHIYIFPAFGLCVNQKDQTLKVFVSMLLQKWKNCATLHLFVRLFKS